MKTRLWIPVLFALLQYGTVFAADPQTVRIHGKVWVVSSGSGRYCPSAQELNHLNITVTPDGPPILGVNPVGPPDSVCEWSTTATFSELRMAGATISGAFVGSSQFVGYHGGGHGLLTPNRTARPLVEVPPLVLRASDLTDDKKAAVATAFLNSAAVALKANPASPDSAGDPEAQAAIADLGVGATLSAKPRDLNYYASALSETGKYREAAAVFGEMTASSNVPVGASPYADQAGYYWVANLQKQAVSTRDPGDCKVVLEATAKVFEKGLSFQKSAVISSYIWALNCATHSNSDVQLLGERVAGDPQLAQSFKTVILHDFLGQDQDAEVDLTPDAVAAAIQKVLGRAR